MKKLMTSFTVLLALSITVPAFAQTTPSASTVKATAFLSNEGGVDNATMQRAYKSVAFALTSEDNFLLVKTPAQASIFLSLKCESKSSVSNGITTYDHIIKLSVIDPASRQTLWSIEERGPYPVFHIGGDAWGKDFTKVAKKLAADLQQAETNGNVNLHTHKSS